VQSAETPTITVSKSDKLTIAVGSIGGEVGPQIAKTVQNDLAMSGYFRISPAGNGAFSVQGNAVAGRLQGTVLDSTHKTVLSKSFSGGPRQQAHAFADEILETLTGNMASPFELGSWQHALGTKRFILPTPMART
jgi:hypothetical protein